MPFEPQASCLARRGDPAYVDPAGNKLNEAILDLPGDTRANASSVDKAGALDPANPGYAAQNFPTAQKHSPRTPG